MKDILLLCKELEESVQAVYEDGVTIEQAEKLAAKMLGAQMKIAMQLASIDLDSRMKKNGVKSVKAAVYMDEISKHEKKPAEAYLENAVNLNELVCKEQDSYERSDAEKNALSTYLGIFKDAHIYFRTVAKGNFNG